MTDHPLKALTDLPPGTKITGIIGDPKFTVHPPAKPVINEATKQLLFLAAHIRSLREEMGLDYQETDQAHRIGFRPGFSRPWLKQRGDSPELSFDPDVYALTVNDCSDGERWCRLFILNVWNPSYARIKGWTFDLFRAAKVLDSGNMKGICYVLQHPSWP